MVNYNNYYDQNQYVQSPQMNVPCCYACPIVQNYYRSCQPAYTSFYQAAPQEDFSNYRYSGWYRNGQEYLMTKQQVDQVVDMVKQESTNIFKGIQQFVTDTKLLDYMLVALVSYVCYNYNKYKDVIEEKTDELVEDMRKNLPWLFDILALFDITPEMVDRFLDNLIRLTVMGIRRLLPAA